MFGLRLPELLVILGIVILLFGAKKLPQLADSLGKGIRAFKKASDQDSDKDEQASQQQAQLRDGSATAKPPAEAKKSSGSGPA
jgi:sec-independent protein translocase protein TatA